MEGKKKLGALLIAAALMGVLPSCGGGKTTAPAFGIKVTPPKPDVTLYSEALYKLGMMSVIYNTPMLYIQSENIYDDTGASSPLATGGEIQRDITEIMKSTLNSIGGRVVFVDYDPAYVRNSIVTGYSNFPNKKLPDVVVTGGITGFDRALDTISKSKNFSVDVVFPHIQNKSGNLPPSKLLGFSWSNSQKLGFARITLDFTLKSFKTLTGIPYMSVTNSIVVKKKLNDTELAISIFGPTFGWEGSTKCVQGRHEAVRLLVQLSMIQLVGRYLGLPYWRLLGKDAKPDKIVLLKVDRVYGILNDFARLVNVQQWLYLYGYNINLSGKMDKKTIAALEDFCQKHGLKFDPKNPKITKEIFKEIYLNIPVTQQAYNRRMVLLRALSSASQGR